MRDTRPSIETLPRVEAGTANMTQQQELPTSDHSQPADRSIPDSLITLIAQVRERQGQDWQVWAAALELGWKDFDGAVRLLRATKSGPSVDPMLEALVSFIGRERIEILPTGLAQINDPNHRNMALSAVTGAWGRKRTRRHPVLIPAILLKRSR